MKHNRLISLVFALVLLLPLMCACATGTSESVPEPSETSVDAPSGGESSEESVDEGFFGYNIANPDGYDGKTFTFLTTYANSVSNWQIDPYSSPDFSESTATGVMSAVAERTLKVEETLKVDIKERIIITSKRTGGGETYDAIIKDITGGLNEYDVIMPCTRDAALLATEGYLLDLASEVKGLDVTNPWWCSRYNEDTAIGGKIYFTIGDIGYINKNATMFVAFNKAMMEEQHLCAGYGYDNLYEMVYDKAWTQDVMYAMSKAVYKDENHNNKCDTGDINGIGGQDSLVQWMLFAGGERIAKIQSDGYPALTLNNTRAVTLIEKTQEFAQSAQNGYLSANDYFDVSSIPVTDVIVPEFTAGKCLFFMDAVLNMDLIRGMEQDFGVVPLPLYDDTQDDYSSSISYWSSDAVCITNAFKDDEARLAMVADVLEAMGAASRRILVPVYYTQTLKNQISRDSESEKMLDIIFENRTLELATAYNWGSLAQTVYDMFKKPIGSFVSSYQSVEEAAKKELENTIDIFKKRTTGDTK